MEFRGRRNGVLGDGVMDFFVSLFFIKKKQIFTNKCVLKLLVASVVK